MFGRFTYPCRHTGKEFSISIGREGESYRYLRECGKARVEKIIASADPVMFIHPVEPVNLPKEVTRFLEIVFDPLVIEPESGMKVYLTFPLEIGVFVAKEDEYQLLDVFSRCLPKYSLYGSPENGVITRFHRSRVSDTPPNPDPACEGVLELTIRNKSRGWVEVSRAVFECYFMPIYFDRMVAMTGEMVLFSKMIAETRILEQPPRPGMTPAIPAIRARKLLLVDVEKKSFLMEHGVA
ncbi:MULTISPECIES: DUF432 domain-containing protein [unclassified Methanoregula]|uniref:DUF432 domain-containing protein n=1 Tax=unclassified Methanoregula TaxID=2649730 RepID=UPI0009C7F274|nr:MULTISPECIES: DUF432 domain-containing protein [unclassified Methanoregula]OPX64887.1 MAG: hypothetical protein A4E33_00625 [Methanoregula sp. PtaB.Bin085]OPY32939.1 MAG: hypothetical protein A4E34_02316 [Methanoregula sp. PtaU1.Bin006]